MSKEQSRRSFIKKLITLGSTAALTSKNSYGMEAQEPVVTHIEALGFQWKTLDPFLFCVHHEDFYPKGTAKMGPDPALLAGRRIGQDFLVKDGWRMYHGAEVPGFPGHPHRGFETVTVVRKGMVDHSDSMGAAGRYGDGDVQWMTAGKGVQHAEMFPLIRQDQENPMELFQIWLNLPKASKFVDPHFTMLWSESIKKPVFRDENNRQIMVEVIAGSLGGTDSPAPPPNSWAARQEHEVAIWNIHMDAGAKWELPAAAAGLNRTLYFYKGNTLSAAGENIPNYHMAQLRSDRVVKLEAGDETVRILVLQGKPIGEPVVQHGPFVMNTKQEIQQAFDDYQQTGFGGWPWPTTSPVHGSKGRFARHADGTVEEKS